MSALALLAAAALLAGPAEARGARELRVRESQGLATDMQPGVVAQLLARVEAEWTAKAISCLRGERDNATTLSEIQLSCSKIASSIVQGSDGNKDNVVDYMSDVCNRNTAKSVEERGCQTFAGALKRLMSDDESTNRNDLDFPGFCASYYKATVVAEAKAEKERADKEAAEKKAAEEKAAKEAAEKKAAAEKAAKEAAEKKAAEEKAAKEAAEKKAAEEKAAREAAEKKAAEEKAEQEVREAEEKARKAAEVAAEKRKAITQRKSAASAASANEPLAKNLAAATPAKPDAGAKKQLTLASVRSPKTGPKGFKNYHEKRDEVKHRKSAVAPVKNLKGGRAKA